MDRFRKLMRGGLAGWRRTSGRAGSRGARSDRAETHQRVRAELKRETADELAAEEGTVTARVHSQTTYWGGCDACDELLGALFRAGPGTEAYRTAYAERTRDLEREEVWYREVVEERVREHNARFHPEEVDG